MLVELLKREGHILTDVCCDTWEELVDILAEPMISNGLIQSGFVESAKEAVKQFGPYVILIEDIAFFHGRPDAGVNELAMSLAFLRKPVYINEKQIKTAFLLAATDNNSHIDLLQELSKVLNDDECVELLINGKDVKSILNKMNGGLEL